MHLPNDLIERLEGYVEKLNRETPGVTFTRTDAVRVLLTRALDRAEAGGVPAGHSSGTPVGTKRKI